MTPAAPDDVSALIEQIRSFLADAPNGKPHEGYRYGELLSQAANALERLAAENERLVVWGRATFEAGFQERQRAERAEAEVARLKEDNALLDSDHNRIGVKCDEAEAELRACLDRWNKANGEANDNFMLLSDKHTLMTERAERAEAEVARLTHPKSGEYFGPDDGIVSWKDRALKAEQEFVKMLADAAAWQRKYRCEFDRADRAEALAKDEYGIVARIWEIYGNPDYKTLDGKSLYDLIEADKSDLARLRATVKHDGV